MVVSIFMGNEINVRRRGELSGDIQEFFGLKRKYRALSDSWWHHQGLSNFWETYRYKEIISSGLVSRRFS